MIAHVLWAMVARVSGRLGSHRFIVTREREGGKGKAVCNCFIELYCFASAGGERDRDEATHVCTVHCG